MSTKFILSCESTVDLPFAYVSERNIPVIFYTYFLYRACPLSAQQKKVRSYRHDCDNSWNMPYYAP